MIAKVERVTIKDLAHELELSYATVSRALNNHPRISQRTKERVLLAAQNMGYRPNYFAKSLVKRKSNLIGLLVYDFRNTFYPELIRIIQDKAEELGYWVIQGSTDDKLDKSNSLITSMMNTGVDGIIIASVREDDQTVKNLFDAGFAVVLVNRRIKEDVGDYVVLDNVDGAYLAVNHLLRMGRRRVGMIKGPSFTSTGEERYIGYLKAIQDAGLPLVEGLVEEGFFREDVGHQLAKCLMSKRNPPDAILCGDDEIAMGAMRALDDMGLRVPDDVGLIGFDDSRISSHPRIQLTTISQDVTKMGSLATEILIRRIEGRSSEYERITLKPNLVIRKSCGFEAGEQKCESEAKMK
ncbi:LacI family DNA-binding transcriptional regulator [Acidobacteriota bacterium]